MKKHTLVEHLDDLGKWDSENGWMFLNNFQLAWFTAYERWLNDRPLLTEEDKKA